MATVEERLAFVEGRLADQSQMFADIRETLVRLEQRLDGRLVSMDARLVSLEQRLDARLVSMDQRLTALDQSVIAVRRDASIDFKWIVGIQVTTLIAVVGALAGALLTR